MVGRVAILSLNMGYFSTAQDCRSSPVASVFKCRLGWKPFPRD